MRHDADLVVPDSTRDEIAVLKGVAAHYVMRARDRVVEMERQRELLEELGAGLLRHAPDPLTQVFRDDWDDAPDDAGRVRVVVDQLAALTDVSAIGWHRRSLGARVGAMAAGFVVVGGGLAAARCVETLRAEGYGGTVTVLAAEPRLPYDRPPLSKQVLKGEDEPDSVVLQTESWYAEHDIEVRLALQAVDLDVDRHRVRTAGGDSVDYERLLLATGSRVRTLPVQGADLDGVVTLRTLEDSVALRDRLAQRPRVVVVGAGWIGMEAAAAGRKHGAEVTVVSPEAPMVRALGPGVSDIYAAAHRDAGVTLLIGPGIDSFRGRGGWRRSSPPTGRSCRPIWSSSVWESPRGQDWPPARPRRRRRARWCRGRRRVAAYLGSRRLRRGRLRAWPCAPLGGRRVHVEHWANAEDGGPVAGRSMLGQDVTHDVLPFFWSDQYDLGMEYAGHVVDPRAPSWCCAGTSTATSSWRSGWSTARSRPGCTSTCGTPSTTSSGSSAQEAGQTPPSSPTPRCRCPRCDAGCGPSAGPACARADLDSRPWRDGSGTRTSRWCASARGSTRSSSSTSRCATPAAAPARALPVP